MLANVKEQFLTLWKTYFQDAPLPIGFYFTVEPTQKATLTKCVIAGLHQVRNGKTLVYSKDSLQCFGAKAYLGYSTDHVPSKEGQDYTFTEQFLADGIPNMMPGEKLKQSPEICRQMYSNVETMCPLADYLILKRWDMFTETEEPEVVIFFAKPDVLAGLYNLLNYDTADVHAVITPWGSGCSSIISDPYLQKDADKPKAILGMLDVAARAYTESGELTLALPFKRLLQVMEYWENTFVKTKAWETIQKRI